MHKTDILYYFQNAHQHLANAAENIYTLIALSVCVHSLNSQQPLWKQIWKSKYFKLAVHQHVIQNIILPRSTGIYVIFYMLRLKNIWHWPTSKTYIGLTSNAIFLQFMVINTARCNRAWDNFSTLDIRVLETIELETSLIYLPDQQHM